MQRVCPKGETAEMPRAENALRIRLRQRRRADLPLCGGFETGAAQTVGETLPERRPRVGVKDDLVAPAARPAAPEFDSAALAGLRERDYGATVTH